MSRDASRAHLAYMMWCYEQGYLLAQDRLGDNWMLDDPTAMHPDDVKTREGLLGMADEVLDLVYDDLRAKVEALPRHMVRDETHFWATVLLDDVLALFDGSK